MYIILLIILLYILYKLSKFIYRYKLNKNLRYAVFTKIITNMIKNNEDVVVFPNIYFEAALEFSLSQGAVINNNIYKNKFDISHICYEKGYLDKMYLIYFSRYNSGIFVKIESIDSLLKKGGIRYNYRNIEDKYEGFCPF